MLDWRDLMRIAVAGAGLSGLTICHALQEGLSEAGKDAEIFLFESEGRTGGKVQTIKENGYLVEWGPNGFLNNKPDTLELCRKLGIDDRLLPSDDNARKRFVYAGGTLHRLPESPPSFFKSRLISWPGKLRMMREILVKPAPPGNDQTLAEFATRRLGPEALEKLIGPMASGVFGGDPETMSLKSCFPAIYNLEQEYGGLFKGLLGKMKEKKRAAKDAPKSGPAGPGGVLTSFQGGLEVLTGALTDAFNGTLLKASPVTRVVRTDAGYEVHADGQDSPIRVDAFVSASPAYAASVFMRGIDPSICEAFDAIPYAPMAVVTFGIRKENIGRDLDGFGFLVGMKEHNRLLGTLWDSSIFPGRAPEGYGSLRSMLGGARDMATPFEGEDKLVGYVKEDLGEIMGLHSDPEFVKVFVHEKAIPQYLVGHSRNIDALDAMEKKHPGVFFGGNALRGVGINDCVREGIAVADRVVAHMKG